MDIVARIFRILAGVLILLLVIGLAYLLGTSDPWSFQYGLPARIVQVVGMYRYVALLAAVALLVTLIAVVRARAASGIGQLLLVVPLVTLAGLLYQWIG